MANGKKGDAGRAYARLTGHDRNRIEEMPKKRASRRRIAKAMGEGAVHGLRRGGAAPLRGRPQ